MNVARRDGRDFGAVLRLFFLERSLYRLSISRYRKGFLLKGALLFFARANDDSRPFTRPTKDVDLEVIAMRPDIPGVQATVAAIAATPADEDGVRFDPDTITVEPIREDDRYAASASMWSLNSMAPRTAFRSTSVSAMWSRPDRSP